MIKKTNIIGKELRKIRLKNRLSQAKLAEKLDVSRVYISNVEKGKSVPSLEKIIKILEAVGAKNHIKAKAACLKMQEILTQLNEEERFIAAMFCWESGLISKKIKKIIGEQIPISEFPKM